EVGERGRSGFALWARFALRAWVALWSHEALEPLFLGTREPVGDGDLVGGSPVFARGARRSLGHQVLGGESPDGGGIDDLSGGQTFHEGRHLRPRHRVVGTELVVGGRVTAPGHSGFGQPSDVGSEIVVGRYVRERTVLSRGPCDRGDSKKSGNGD